MLLALQAVATIGEMGTMARRVYDALWSIQPTEVEVERAFSGAGLFLTKLSMRMKSIRVNRFNKQSANCLTMQPGHSHF